MKYKQDIYNVLAVKLYEMAYEMVYRFDIEANIKTILEKIL